MIERGPGARRPEVDPRGFERAMARHDTVILPKSRARSRSAGIVFMGMGAALMFLIGFAGGEPGAAIGVGGAIIIVGVAFLVNGLMSGGQEVANFERYAPVPPPFSPARHLQPASDFRIQNSDLFAA
jgi:hypothetical protein